MNPSEPRITYNDEPMDRSLSPEQLRRQQFRKGLIGGIALFLVVFSFIGLRSFLRKRIDRGGLTFSTVEVGIVENAFMASGRVIPSFEQNLTSPLRGRIEEVHFSIGENVPKGASLLKLDVSESRNDYINLVDQLAVKRLKLAQTRSSQQKELIDLESSMEIQKLEIQNQEKELEDEVYLEKIGGSTQEKVQQIQNNLLIKQKELEKVKRNIDYQKAYNQTEIQSLEYDLSLLQRDIASMEDKFTQAEIRADREGVISYLNSQVGNWVSAGEVVAKLTDFSRFKVEAKISTDYADRVKPGTQARIRVDDTDLEGMITQVNPSVEGGAITFWIQPEQADHELLRPNLSVDVFVIISFSDHVLRVENGSYYGGGNFQQVFVVKDNKAYRREIEVGASNFDYLEIKSGLQAGETLIISDMSQHETLSEITLIEK